MDIRNESVSLVGVPVDSLTMEQTIARIETFIGEGGFHQVATANVNFLVNSLRIPELHRVLSSCDMVVPDGMPLIWCSRLMKQPLKERVTGADIVPRLAELSESKGYRIYFLGSTEESSRLAVEHLQEQYPGMQVVGRYCPTVVTMDGLESAGILDRIREAKPDILLVAFGNPKQDLWIARHRNDLNVPVCIGIGGTLEMLAGFVDRAPMWIQHSGLEWLYRIAQEPRRLAGRYARDFANIIWPMTRQFLSMFFQSDRRSLNSLTMSHCGDVTLMHIAGGVTATDMERICAMLSNDPEPRNHLLLDMTRISYLGPDALAILMRQASEIHRRDGSVWVTGLNQQIKQMLRISNAGHLLRTAKSTSAVLERFPAIGDDETYHEDHAVSFLPGDALRRQSYRTI
jgi:N-acetylglucosaminyldiphosphoundecaprenol N-acetyl-beta-D-mannosaminyltransferase